MKVFAISDLHLSLSEEKPMDVFGGQWENYLDKIKTDWKAKVAQDDVVILAGDLSWAMRLEQLALDLKYFDDLPGKKVIVRGNHDYWWSSLSKVKNALPSDFFVLQNNAVKIDKYIFCGTRGWNLPGGEDFDKDDEKIYNREQIRLQMALQSANDLRLPDDKVILIMHYPPYNFKSLDNEFMKLIAKYSPDTVVFGHIHKSRGKYQLATNVDNIRYFLTSCDLLENKLVLLYDDFD